MNAVIISPTGEGRTTSDWVRVPSQRSAEDGGRIRPRPADILKSCRPEENRSILQRKSPDKSEGQKRLPLVCAPRLESLNRRCRAGARNWMRSAGKDILRKKIRIFD